MHGRELAARVGSVAPSPAPGPEQLLPPAGARCDLVLKIMGRSDPNWFMFKRFWPEFRSTLGSARTTRMYWILRKGLNSWKLTEETLRIFAVEEKKKKNALPPSRNP